MKNKKVTVILITVITWVLINHAIKQNSSNFWAFSPWQHICWTKPRVHFVHWIAVVSVDITLPS